MSVNSTSERTRDRYNADSIVEFKLYKVGSPTAGDDPYAEMYIDPRDSTETQPVYNSYVRELLPNVDYAVYPREFWIQLSSTEQVRDNQFLACYMEVRRTSGELERVGSLNLNRGDTISLKLLKPIRRNSEDHTWDYEWKNVYSLGVKNLEITEFEFDIYKGLPGNERDASNLNNNDDSEPYLQVFGLDKVNDNAQPTPDGRIDNSLNILDLGLGHVFFPNEKPFDPDDGSLTDEERVPEIYDAHLDTELREASKFYFRIQTYDKRSAVYNLGRINILEDSETVTLDNRRLNRGTDYEIDYEVGTIRFLNERALDPNSELNIDYEYAPFISVNKKTLFGMRAEYSTGPALELGSTFLYKGQKSTDRQPKLGQEQSQDIVAEFDFSYAASPRWMTSMANFMPLVETTKPSRLMVSGEVARSIPNPNSLGYVLLDDFEGTKLSTTLGTLRRSWTQASLPNIYPDKTDENRAKFFWFNPYNDLLATEVYNRDIEGGTDTDHRIQTLNLEIRPDTSLTDPRDSWGGCMRAVSTAYEDQTRAEFLELRIGYDETINVEGLDGVLHVDLGEISEDLDGDGELDTEDIRRGGLYNGQLDEGEDTGLDGLFNEDEPGYDPDTNPDPNGDDWLYIDDPSTRYNYEQINGTEGNGSGEYQDFGGINPDTESINGDNNLDQTNDYFSFAIDFANTEYYVEGSEYSKEGSRYTFRTYRIPLWEVSNVAINAGNGNPSLIRFARLWMDGFEERSQVVIAAMEIVENRWQAQDFGDSLTTDKSFRAEVINTEENANYYSPPGVGGFLNREARFREREQSLLLRFENLAPGDTGWAKKILNRTEDYTGYEELKMWVHGDTDISPDTNVYSLIFRFGRDEDNYYEYHVDLDTGWTESNSVHLNFDDLTPLKSLLPTTEAPDGVLEQWQDPNIKIRGNPSLTQILYQAVGITYKEGNTATLDGEVWVNELRLESVRNDQGTAARVSVTADFADLVGFTINSEIQTYSFRGLTGGGRGGQGANLLNGATRIRHDANTRVSVDKFLPASWRVSLPVTVKYTKDVSEPKLMTGSDIVLTPELRRRETTTKISHRVSVSERMNLPTKHWLATITANAFSMTGSYSMEKTWSPRQTGDRETYAVSGKYNLSLKNLLPIHPLAWTRYLFFPKMVWSTKLNLLPKSFNADANINRSRSNTTNSRGYRVFEYSRRFRGKANWSLTPFKSLGGEYGFTTERDLYDPKSINLSFNPRDFRLGTETKFTQRLGVRYTPPFFRFLSPNATYNVDYQEDSDPKRYTGGTRKGVVNANFSASASLNFKSILGSDRGGRRRREVPRQRPQARVITGEEEDQPPDEDKDGEKEEKKDEESEDGGGFTFKPHKAVLWLMRQLTSPIDPIKGTYRHGESRTTLGLLDRPPLQYRFGLSKDLGVDRDLGGISGRGDRDSENLSDTYGLNSRVNVLGLTRVAVSYEHRKTSVFTTTSTRNTSTTFPKMSTSLDNLDKVFLINKIAPLRWVLRMVSINMNYTHETQLSEKITQDTLNENSLIWAKETQGTTDDVGVSVRWSHSFKSGWRINADYDWSYAQRSDERYSTNQFLDTRKKSQGVGFSSNYSFRAPNGIRFPLLRSLRLKSTLTLNISANYDINKTESRNPQADDPSYQPKQDRSRLTIRTRANYSFSASMKGGFELNWVDEKDNITNRPRHTRQVSLWIEFTF